MGQEKNNPEFSFMPNEFDNELDNDEELNPEALRKKEALKRAKELRDRLNKEFVGHPPADPSFVMDLLKAKIPGLTGLLQGMGKTGGTITSLVTATGHASQPLQAAGSGLHIAGAALSAVDFVRIPLVFLAAYIAGEKPPVTLSKTARWLYSGVGLGLALTAILLPVAAPYIGIAGAAMALGVSVISMGNMIYQRRKLKKSMEKTQGEIDEATIELNTLTEKVTQLESELGTLDAVKDAERINEIEAELTELDNEAEQRSTALQALHDKFATDKAKRDKMGFTAFMDKGVAIGLGSLIVIGAVLTLFFPVAGLSILAAAGALGVSYAAARFIGPMVAPYVKKLGSWVASKFTKEKGEADDPAKELENTVAQKETLLLNESVQDERDDKPLVIAAPEKNRARLSLFRNKSKEELTQLQDTLKIQQEHMDEMDRKLTLLVERQDTRGVLNFFTGLKTGLKAECPHEDLSCVSDLFESITPALKLLDKAISQFKKRELKLSEEEQLALENSVELISALLDKSKEVLKSDIQDGHEVNLSKKDNDKGHDEGDEDDDSEGIEEDDNEGMRKK